MSAESWACESHSKLKPNLKRLAGTCFTLGHNGLGHRVGVVTGLARKSDRALR